MAITQFIPELWNANTLDALDRAHVYTQPGVANRDYEGQIRQMGDTVNVTTIADPHITDYAKGTALSYEELADSQQVLTIDQGKYYGFNVQDIDRVQAAGNFVVPAAHRAAWGLADKSDRFVAALLQAAVPSGNYVLGSGSLSASGTAPSGAYSALRKMKTALDKLDVPTSGRWVITSPDFAGLLLDDDRLVKVNESGTTEALRNGFIGRLFGFDILTSNNAPSGRSAGTAATIAGYSGAASFAEQLLETEAFRSQVHFADTLRGLYVYGGKVFRAGTLVAVETTN